jgi:hypothetical protein
MGRAPTPPSSRAIPTPHENGEPDIELQPTHHSGGYPRGPMLERTQKRMQSSLSLAAQSVKPKYPGEIAAASDHIAQRNEDCRRQAREQHLHLVKRYHFMRDCKRQ